MPTRTDARRWLERWDHQQERYIADREERFEVVGDVVAEAGGPTPTVLDLGAGPGSLSVRLLGRLPGARVVAVDADPLLLGLARAAHADLPGLELVAADLRDASWRSRLPVEQVDAIVSTTALHWLTTAQLRQVYDASAHLLRPGGVLVDGDHLAGPSDLPRIGEIGRAVERGRADRAGVLANEDWESWWTAVAGAPELADLVDERGARPLAHDVPDPADLADHERLLREAGFAEVGTVWQRGSDRVLVAVR